MNSFRIDIRHRILAITHGARRFAGRKSLLAGCLAGVGLMLVCSVAPLAAQEGELSPDKRLRNATLSFREAMHEPDKGIPHDLFDKSRCIVIIPGVKKGAFIVGGKYGRGFVSCRRGGTGRFGSPAAIRIEGGSYGLQIGGSSTDVFMLIMNEGGMHKLLADKFTIGGEAEAAAGPVGRDTSANTDVLLHAEILSWSRSRGLFAGLSLEGSTLRPDEGEDRKLYGESISNEQILQGDVKTAPGARALVAELNRYRGEERHGDVSASLRDTGRVTLSNVHFAPGKADITPSSEASLSEAVNALKEHPDWNIRVEGFTDNVGSPDANLKLSSDRAAAVMNWLADHGIDKGRLSAKGYGEDRPVTKNSTPAGRAKNRRVELVKV
ncbi:MAG: YSC84-related protein [Candidatus Acidiferrum sp.]|jgi:lipid-binding SYLF domain-containing protein